MALTLSNLTRSKEFNKWVIRGKLAFDSSYPTGGEALAAGDLGLAYIDSVFVESAGGYTIDANVATGGASAQLLVYQGGSGTTGATSGGTPAAQTFTGTASTTGEVTAFSGTGQASAGQVITTTDNQTMTLNQCAGMWFISATHGPYYIVSNTAVTGAPAVLTVIGDAPTTDAGEYRIVKSPTPAGTNSASAALATHTHSVSSAAGSQVANGTNLSTLTNVEFQATGA